MDLRTRKPSPRTGLDYFNTSCRAISRLRPEDPGETLRTQDLRRRRDRTSHLTDFPSHHSPSGPRRQPKTTTWESLPQDVSFVSGPGRSQPTTVIPSTVYGSVQCQDDDLRGPLPTTHSRLLSAPLCKVNTGQRCIRDRGQYPDLPSQFYPNGVSVSTGHLKT